MPRVPVVYEVLIPMELPSAANRSAPGNWRAHSNLVKQQRKAPLVALRVAFIKFDWPGSAVITLTRRGGRGLDDDNLQYAFKAVRDGVADWLGIDDGDKRLTWKYAQQPGGEKGVHIRIEETT